MAATQTPDLASQLEAILANPKTALALDRAVEKEFDRRTKNKIESLYPEQGKYRRELYPKHQAFFEAGGNHLPTEWCIGNCDGTGHRQRAVVAANRVGKTLLGGYEIVAHLTGRYPKWWKGRRFTEPINAWACGDTSKTVRDIIQEKLLGPIGNFGTGLIPADCIVKKPSNKPGVVDAVEIIYVKHVSTDKKPSMLVLKSFDQGRESFQGTEQDVIWIDEESPRDVYDECLMRTMGTGDRLPGIMLCTFTPLQGRTELVEKFMGTEKLDEGETQVPRFCLTLTWDDAPHLNDKEKAELIQAFPSYQRDARTKGIPDLGAGAIYPIDDSMLVEDDFPIPAFWPKCFALDVGWRRTACLWGALDRDSDVLHIWSEHYAAEENPNYHVAAIKARGEWIKGVIDPAANQRSQRDGEKLMDDYRKLGLDLTASKNAVEAGIWEVWQRMLSGRLKIFRSCRQLFREKAVYRRGLDGKPVKKDDHLVDCLKYLLLSGLKRATTNPGAQPINQPMRVVRRGFSGNGAGWTAA